MLVFNINIPCALVFDVLEKCFLMFFWLLDASDIVLFILSLIQQYREEDDDEGVIAEGEESNEGSGDVNEPFEGEDTEVFEKCSTYLIVWFQIVSLVVHWSYKTNAANSGSFYNYWFSLRHTACLNYYTKLPVCLPPPKKIIIT